MTVKIRTFLIRNWPITLIILSTFILRIWKLEELFYFSYDESIPAFVGKRIVTEYDIPLIGGVTPFGLHLTPYFYWFSAILLAISNLNPLIWGFFGALLSCLTVYLIYKVGCILDSKKLGLVSALLWSFSYLANMYDRHFWALYFGPIVSLGSIFCLYMISKGKKLFVYPLTLIFIIGMSADLSSLPIILLILFFWLRLKLPINKHTYLAIGIFLLSFLPLVLFDLRHNFANTRPLLSWATNGQEKVPIKTHKVIDNLLIFPRTFTRLIYTPGDNEVAKIYSYCSYHVEEKYQSIPKVVLIITIFTLIVSIIYLLLKSKKNLGWQFAIGAISFYFLGINIYYLIARNEIYEHYLAGLFPFLILIAAKIIIKLPNKIMVSVIIFIITANVIKLLNAQSGQGLTQKRLAIQYTMEKVGKDDFSLDSTSSCLKYAGYRYLFSVYGREPVKSYVDPNFGYLYGKTPIAQNHPDKVAVFILHDYIPETADFYARYNLLKLHQIENQRFGDIEVIILNNATKWFK